MTMQPIIIGTSRGLKLRGIIHRSQGVIDAAGQGAILLPGMTGNRVGPHRILFDLAGVLVKRGWTVLRCDLSGMGYSDGPPARLAHYLEDIRYMIRYLKTDHGATRILAGGICGGAKVALATALRESEIEALILMGCPQLQDRSVEKKIVRRRIHHIGAYARKFFTLRWIPRLLEGDLNLPMIGKVLVTPADRGTLERIGTDNLPLDLSKLSAKALFIYGENDPDLARHLNYYKTALEGYATRISFEIIPEADRAFYAARWHAAVLKMVDNWLKENNL